MSLEKSKRNEIFRAIEKVGLRPEEFRWGGGGGDDDRLTHIPSQAYCIVGGIAGAYRLRYAAGDAPMEERQKLNWSPVMTWVESWLWSVRTDSEMPDLWGDLARQREMLGPAPVGTIENTPFTAEERGEIARQLREIQEQLKRSFVLSHGESLALDGRLAYFEEVAGRLGRIDWRNAVVGAMFGLGAAAALPPEVVRALLHTLLQGVAHLFGLGLLDG